MRLFTPRLELIRAWADPVRAAARDDRARLAALLDADVPADWPHEFLGDALPHMADALERQPPQDGYTMWFVVQREPRVLIGTAGLKSPPNDGRVDIGYGVVASFRRRGYAGEATRRLIDMAFEDPAVNRIVAETMPDLTASIRVLEKCGFVQVAAGVTGFSGEEGVIQYELKRPSTAPQR